MYVPAVTEFVAAAKQVGAAVVSGVSLFVFQGVDAFKFFVKMTPNARQQRSNRPRYLPTIAANC